jgi:hypothetical protein
LLGIAPEFYAFRKTVSAVILRSARPGTPALAAFAPCRGGSDEESLLDFCFKERFFGKQIPHPLRMTLRLEFSAILTSHVS